MLFTLPCSILQWAAFATFCSLLFNFLGNFDDDELSQWCLLRGPGKLFVLIGRIGNFLFSGYSKFTQACTERIFGSWPAIPGFLTVYGGALLLSVFFCCLYKDEWSAVLTGGASFWDMSTAALLAGCSFLHYIKRCIEVLFVHKYSDTSRVEVVCAVSICGWYASNVAVTVWLTVPTCACGGPPDGRVLRVVGLALWLLGQVSNAYHHLLLRWLRTTGQPLNTESKYQVPRGGLFEYVAAPHYLCEMINWLGIALMCGHSVVWVMHGCNLTYLSGRAVVTRRYYLEKVDGYPSERKSMIPFVF